MSGWFQVDKKGLAKLMEGRGKEFILYELLQNAWDTDAKEVQVSLCRIPSTRFVELRVADDDPNGFDDLVESYTLFAESKKKTNPEKRGRFNLGEKLVLALSIWAQITSTKGTIIFEENKPIQRKRKGSESGSEILCHIKMTLLEMEHILACAHNMIPPEGCETFINRKKLVPPKLVTSEEVTLPTIIADEEGVLRPTKRKTKVNVYEPREGEEGTIYEMGIPIVKTGDKYHADIQQKVPLTMDRENVTPSYLKLIRTTVLNATHDLIDDKEASEPWVRDACTHKDVTAESIQSVKNKRFGEDAVAYDPSDIEANKIAMSQGRQVIYGGALSSAEWGNYKRHEAVLPAGKVTPSPKPFSPDGEPLKMLDPEHWTQDVRDVYAYIKQIARELLRQEVSVQIANDRGWPFDAAYGDGRLVLNSISLRSRGWFNVENVGHLIKINKLLIHEFAHDRVSDHLSNKFHDECCRLGAALTEIALKKPEIFAFCKKLN